MERGERNSDVLMSYFQMLNEQRKRVSSAVELIELKASDGRVEKTTWVDVKEGRGITDAANQTGSRTTL